MSLVGKNSTRSQKHTPGLTGSQALFTILQLTRVQLTRVESKMTHKFKFIRREACWVDFVYEIEAESAEDADEIYYNSPPDPTIEVGDSIKWLDSGLEVRNYNNG
jgi:hypothetical protein